MFDYRGWQCRHPILGKRGVKGNGGALDKGREECMGSGLSDLGRKQALTISNNTN